jgi:putative restriction endonuclease
LNQQTLIEQFLNIRTWIGDGGRAPHKPLLLLYALGQLAKGETKFPFVEIDKTVKQLLQDFGPPRNSYHPEYPF